MKITLISPTSDIQAFGIRTLSSCLKQKGYEVQLIFLPRQFTNPYEEKTLNELVELSRDSHLIGISLMTNFFDNVVQITKRLKEDLNAPILWGGIHPTIRPEECLNYVDMVCVGEGEKTLLELADKIKDKKDFYDIQGMWFNNKEIIKNKLRPLIQDLDSLPFPDYDNKTHYILDKESICKMDDSLLHKYLRETYITMPTRGCPFQCTYCCNNVFHKIYPNQNLLRRRSIDNIINELMEIKDRFPFIKYIKFDDDAFFIYSVEQIKEFSEKYKNKIGLPLLIAELSPLTFSEEKFSLLVDGGLKDIRMGIQSGSENTKKLYKRNYSNQQIENVIKIINKFKDKINPPSYDIILDNPLETDENLIETLMFLTKLPTPFGLGIFSLTFYPETELYEIAKRKGIIKNDLEDVYRKYYHSCKKTYLNKLFFLLNDYVRGGGRISTKVMFLLTNKKLRKLKISWLLYSILKIGSIPFRIPQLKVLLNKGLKDIKEGDWSRITRYIKRKGNPAVPIKIKKRCKEKFLPKTNKEKITKTCNKYLREIENNPAMCGYAMGN